VLENSPYVWSVINPTSLSGVLSAHQGSNCLSAEGPKKPHLARLWTVNYLGFFASSLDARVQATDSGQLDDPYLKPITQQSSNSTGNKFSLAERLAQGLPLFNLSKSPTKTKRITPPRSDQKAVGSCPFVPLKDI